MERIIPKSQNLKKLKKKLEDEGVTLKQKYVSIIMDLCNKLKYFSIEKRSEAQRVFRKIAGLTVQ